MIFCLAALTRCPAARNRMMRRISIIFILALAMIVAGCSKDVPTKAMSSDDAWRHDVTLPVPVMFGASTNPTKAMINTTQDMNHGLFGVFAFDKSVLADAVGDLTADDGMNMRNAYSVCKVKDGVGSLDLVDDWFYPMNRETEYEFFAYHIYQSLDNPSVKLVMEEKRALIEMTVAGTNDVLWAKASSAEPITVDGVECGGYNAKYVREGGAMPSFHFSHPVACVAFTACVDAEMSGNYMRIDHVTMLGVHTKATLCIVDIENPENNGKFVPCAGDVISDKMVVKGGTGNLFLPLTASVQSVGLDAFIVPGAESLKIKVTYSMFSKGADGVAGTSDDAVQTSGNEVEAEIQAGGDSGVFESGHRYLYNLKMITPKPLGAGEDAMEVITVTGYEEAFK